MKCSVVTTFLFRSTKRNASVFTSFLRILFCLTIVLRHSPRVRFYSEKMVYSDYLKQRVLFYHSKGYRAPTIASLLRSKEHLQCSRVGVSKFLKTFLSTGSIQRRPGSGRPSKVTLEVKEIVEQQMRLDDETTAYQLHNLLAGRGYDISLRTVLRCRTALGWTFRGSAYCQLIRDVNKVKRLEWARAHLNDTFDDVIWTDECTVQMESHRCFCCRKQGETPRPKPR